MPVIQFSHANGFPAKTYSYFFEELKKQEDFDIRYINAFGLGKYQVNRNWYPLIDELIEHIEQHGQHPVIGLGHSLGSFITYWAAMRRPDLFSHVIMLDPPYLPWPLRLGLRIFGPLGLTKTLLPIARKAQTRRDQFQSEEEAFEYWRPKSLFRNFHPQCFEDYVQNTLVSDGKGSLTLLIPRELEARIFSLTAWKLGDKAEGVPVHWVYASKSVIPRNNIESYKESFSELSFVEMAGGHMFPLEKPTETASLINKLITQSSTTKNIHDR